MQRGAAATAEPQKAYPPILVTVSTGFLFVGLIGFDRGLMTAFAFTTALRTTGAFVRTGGVEDGLASGFRPSVRPRGGSSMRMEGATAVAVAGRRSSAPAAPAGGERESPRLE